jgi:CheY-like chemotaxis protein
MSLPDDRPAVSPPSGPDPTRDLAAALHEVGNALTVVLGWIERARTAEGAVDLERALDVASARAAQARAIVRRAIGAEVRAEPSELCAELCADALTGLDPELRRAGVHARAAVAPEVASRRVPAADSALQILTNLLLNAAAMSPRGSLVSLEAHAVGDEVVFAVTDAGPGIAPERRADLFHAGLSTRPGGAGIGLRHAAALAASRGGRLTLGEASAGARFELSWRLAGGDHDGAAHPRAPSSYHEAAPPESTELPIAAHAVPRAAALAGTRVLLIEDDDAVIDLLDTALTARGADVVPVRRHADLAVALAGGPFHAALFDISPIGDDVHGAVAAARAANPGLRVVMISGTAVALPTLPEGWIAGWVRKPFEIAEVVQALEPARRG